MSALKKLYCPKCGQGIEGEREVFGEIVLCPMCGNEFGPMEAKMEAAAKTEKLQAGKTVALQRKSDIIRDHAESWESRAMLCGILGAAAIVITLFVGLVSLVGANDEEPATFHPIGIWIGLGFVALGFFIYLIAQAMHIRANTEK
jgi:hypothetical protein